MTLSVVVASRNPVKLAAVQAAFAVQFPGDEISVRSVDVASGVAEQPASDEETRRGARTRSENASRKQPEADYWVGLEGGLDTVDGQLMAFAWMTVRGRDGRSSEARSATLPLPPAVKAMIDEGMELGAANDRVFATVNSKQGGGAYGLLTEGRYTRESIYRQTLIIALIPFVHPLFRQAAKDAHHS